MDTAEVRIFRSEYRLDFDDIFKIVKIISPRVCLSIGLSLDDADDVISISTIYIYNTCDWKNFTEKKFRTYAYKVVRGKALDYARANYLQYKRGKEKQDVVYYLSDIDDNLGPSYSIDDKIFNSHLIYLARRNLNEQEYCIFILRYIKEHTILEVSKMMGISQNIVFSISENIKRKMEFINAVPEPNNYQKCNNK